MVRNQIDFITINKGFRNGVTSSKAYPGCDISSDHNPVAVTLRIKLKHLIKPKHKTERIDWENANNNKLENNATPVEHKLNALPTNSARDDSTEQ